MVERIEFSANRSLRCSVLAACIALTSCQPAEKPQPVERFRLMSFGNERVYRIDVVQGGVHLVTDTELVALGPSTQIKLKVGELYTMEDDKLVAYEGGGKFGPPIEVLLKKYGPKKQSAP